MKYLSSPNSSLLCLTQIDFFQYSSWESKSTKMVAFPWSVIRNPPIEFYCFTIPNITQIQENAPSHKTSSNEQRTTAHQRAMRIVYSGWQWTARKRMPQEMIAAMPQADTHERRWAGQRKHQFDSISKVPYINETFISSIRAYYKRNDEARQSSTKPILKPLVTSDLLDSTHFANVQLLHTVTTVKDNISYTKEHAFSVRTAALVSITFQGTWTPIINWSKRRLQAQAPTGTRLTHVYMYIHVQRPVQKQCVPAMHLFRSHLAYLSTRLSS